MTRPPQSPSIPIRFSTENLFGPLTYDRILINTQNNIAVLTTGETVPLIDVGHMFIVPSAFAEPALPTKQPIDRSELQNHSELWVEPISNNSNQRNVLKGNYKVHKDFVENTRECRFFFDSYGATWLTFEIE